MAQTNLAEPKPAATKEVAMAIPEKIKLKAEANKLGIDGYRTMSQEELVAAIKSAKGTGTAPTKGKTQSANGTKGKTAAKATVKGKTSAAKGKTGTSAPAKSKTRKSSAKPKAATGTAKRPTTAASTKGKATGKTANAKSRGKRPGRVFIDRTKVNWKAESNVGRPGSGKRADVMAALRKYNGDYDKCWDALVKNAKRWYPQHTKDKAEQMVTWLIARVAYDFVMATEQHEPGERAAYGTSERAQAKAKAERAAKRKKAAARKR